MSDSPASPFALSSGTWNWRKREVSDNLMIDAVEHLRRDNDFGVREGPGDPRELNPPASGERYIGSSGKRYPGKVFAQIYIRWRFAAINLYKHYQ